MREATRRSAARADEDEARRRPKRLECEGIYGGDPQNLTTCPRTKPHPPDKRVSAGRRTRTAASWSIAAVPGKWVALGRALDGFSSLGRRACQGVGEDPPAGPGLHPVLAFSLGAAHSVAAFEMADSAFGAGSVAGEASLCSSGSGLLAAGDERPFGSALLQRFGVGPDVEAAVERDLPRRDPQFAPAPRPCRAAACPRTGCRSRCGGRSARAPWSWCFR